ncbi:cyclic peptide export ABC transporter [Polaromonas jejuensis]|uniref:Cyclic peptide export ABC transporter n=1 Tax=Polaromonas jejuensis TaxID=457502 RepID=A0ABW0QFF6_9BURK|nr:cyclic peptide export ABC transporter [Polaromonas jejuensis]
MPSPPPKGPHLLRLLRPHLGWIVLSVLTGLCAGTATVALLATVNGALHRPGGLTDQGLLLYIALCIAALAGRGLSDVCTNLVGQKVVASVRKGLAQNLLHAPLQALERLQSHRLMPILTSDVEIVSHIAFTLSATLISVAVALGCLLYLAVLSPGLFALILAALVAGMGIQAVTQGRGMHGFWSAREREEQLHQAYRTLTEGAKELRLHRKRRVRLQQQITATVDAIRAVNGHAVNTYVLAKAFGSALFFLLIALVLAWGSRGAVNAGEGDAAVLSGFVLVLLFLKGPMDQIATALPTFGRARVALGRIDALRSHFAQRENMGEVGEEIGQTRDQPSSGQFGRSEGAEPFERIELRGVTYTFPPQGDIPAFALGPIDLVLRRGEMVFLVGDNGSGKTTFLKLLLGLYPPTDGEILLDGKPVTAPDRDSYRQRFGIVFSDFHLFDDLDGAEGGAEDDTPLTAAANGHLRRLGLDHKVTLQGGRFSTTDLSTGQRKRLALLQAYLDARPILMLDEWAADQDPAFRDQFYTELLPELRARGHLLLVITHDDRYFHLADRVLRMREGRLVEDTAQSQSPAPKLNMELHARIAREGLARPSTLESAVAALARIRNEGEHGTTGQTVNLASPEAAE